MNKIIVKVITATLMLATLEHPAWSQDFMNLNFENPILPLSPVFSNVSATNAIPNWTAYYGSSNDPMANAITTIGYDTVSLGGQMVALEDTNAPNGVPLPIQGSYSVLLEGSTLAAASTASIGQTGTIPNAAQSLIFYADLGGTVQVSFSGQVLSFAAISNALNYTVYGVDISPFAGQNGQLLFTAPVQNSVLLDNI